jgi:hypothetical protein
MEQGMEMDVNNLKESGPVEPIVYFSQKTLIDNYWIKKKTEMVHLEKKMTAEVYDRDFKEVHKEEARKLYPHKGRYILEGTVLTFIGDK